MARQQPKPDWERVKPSLERLCKAALVDMLGMAFEALPRTRLAEVFGERVFVQAPASPRIRSIAPGPVLGKVRRLHEESLARRYRQGFNVNANNFGEHSDGTRRWISEVRKRFDQCIAASRQGQHAEAHEAMKLLFDLLHRVDDGEDFVFFADEQGAWPVGVDWDTVFPAYFAALAKVATAKEYAEHVMTLIQRFDRHSLDRHLRTASRVADAEQRAALQVREPKALSRGTTT